MLKKISAFVLAAAFCLNIIIFKVQAEEPEIELYSQAAVLIDGDTGRLLYGKNEGKCMPMASTTKIMTCIIVLENMKPDMEAEASSYAAGQPQVRLGVRKGMKFKVEDLLYSLMLESHNDTAVILAEAISGSVENFAVLMNRKAEQIGLKNTHFVTPNGLDAKGHYTTAIELALILRYCIKESDKAQEFLAITRTHSYSFSDLSGKYSYNLSNHNAFLDMMDGALTGKTGFTGNAGYCYTGALKKDGKFLIVALLACGWPGNKGYKWKDTCRLMNYGLKNFEIIKFDCGSMPRAYIDVKDGVFDYRYEKHCRVRVSCRELPEYISILAKKGEKPDTELQLPESIEAPVDKNVSCGEILFNLGDFCAGRFELYPLDNIDKIGYMWYLEKVIYENIIY